MTRRKDRAALITLTSLLGGRAAREFLRHHAIGDLLHLDRKTLLKMRHIGPSRADAILALPDLLRQIVDRPTEGLVVSCSKDVYDLFRFRFSCLSREQFMVLTLNTRNRILSENLCALGGINTVHVIPSEVVRQAVIKCAPNIICLHNHPSGDPTPSPEDRLLTDRISQAASLMGVRMLDHVILASRSYYSFSDAGAL